LHELVGTDALIRSGTRTKRGRGEEALGFYVEPLSYGKAGSAERDHGVTSQGGQKKGGRELGGSASYLAQQGVEKEKKKEKRKWVEMKPREKSKRHAALHVRGGKTKTKEANCREDSQEEKKREKDHFGGEGAGTISPRSRTRILEISQGKSRGETRRMETVGNRGRS